MDIQSLIENDVMRINYSFWKNGSGGFGLGIWRVDYVTQIIWTIAIGPMTVYLAWDKLNTN